MFRIKKCVRIVKNSLHIISVHLKVPTTLEHMRVVSFSDLVTYRNVLIISIVSSRKQPRSLR